jgi:hypothetical protein
MRCAVIPHDGMEPGIYFDLPEDVYHKDPSLGSTDIRRLLTGASEFHYSWAGNPDREERDAEPDYLTFGRAVHKLVLEGRQSFDGLFAERPEGPEVLASGDDMRGWLRAHGLMDKGTKEAMAERIQAVNPNVQIADVIVDRAKRDGRQILSHDAYKRIAMASAYITANPDLSHAFQGGRSEVSVFLIRRGIRLKARLDYLRVIRHEERRCAVVTDLKSFSRMKPGQPIKQAVREAAAGYRHQAVHYLDGLLHAKKHIAQGLVHGEVDPSWLQRVATSETWLWAWVFYKASGAPYARGLTLCPENAAIIEPARMDIENALDVFRRYFQCFGASGPWVEMDSLEELSADELPRWLL